MHVISAKEKTYKTCKVAYVFVQVFYSYLIEIVSFSIRILQIV